jgi:hypothetical protein
MGKAAPFMDDLARLLGLLPAIRLRQCELAVLLRMLSYPGGRVESREALGAGDSHRPALPYNPSAIRKAVASLLKRGYIRNPSDWRTRGNALELNKAALLKVLREGRELFPDRAPVGTHDRTRSRARRSAAATL